MNRTNSITDYAPYQAALEVMTSATAKLNAPTLDEVTQPALYEAQEAAFGQAWDALAAVIDAHTAQAVADVLRGYANAPNGEKAARPTEPKLTFANAA